MSREGETKRGPGGQTIGVDGPEPRAIEVGQIWHGGSGARMVVAIEEQVVYWVPVFSAGLKRFRATSGNPRAHARSL